MNRGRRREDIFEDEGDYRMFLEVLQDTAKMWNLQVSAYCLMSNHYHLLVQTPEGNISRCMRHLNGVYTQKFNRKHNHDGQLFRGRYKAVLVEEDSHLLELLRYIHRNPLEAGMIKNINDYHWSSHQGYLSHTKEWRWLHREFLLKMFAKSQKKAQRSYLEFINQNDSEEIEQFYSRKNLPSIFGSTKFIDTIKNRFESLRWNKEISEASVLSIDAESVLKECEGVKSAVDFCLLGGRLFLCRTITLE
jgi:putative transposase